MQNSGKNQWALSRALSRALYGHCTGTVRALSEVREKQHHYLFPPALRWEGSFVYLFTLTTVFKFPKQKMKAHPRKKNGESGDRVPRRTSSIKKDRGSGNHY